MMSVSESNSDIVKSISIDGDTYEIVDDFYFRTPSLLYLTGTTYSGKTEFILKLIENHQRLFIPGIQRIVFVFAENQPSLFERVRKAYPETEFVNGLFELQSKIEFNSSVP